MIYLVGRHVGVTWEVQGLYDSEEEAKTACEEEWFVMPLKKNKPYPKTSEVCGYYPNL